MLNAEEEGLVWEARGGSQGCKAEDARFVETQQSWSEDTAAGHVKSEAVKTVLSHWPWEDKPRRTLDSSHHTCGSNTARNGLQQVREISSYSEGEEFEWC